jgi:6-pyruvoyl-tetrahydropterin synthase
MKSFLILSFLCYFVGSFAVSSEMFSVGVRDSMMITHSFKGKKFGAAQNLHGTTFVVDAEFSAPALDEQCNWVVDMGEACAVLKEVLQEYHMKNLDELFPSENTTSEFMCRQVHGQLCQKMMEKCNFRGSIRVKMSESPTAWAAYYKKM